MSDIQKKKIKTRKEKEKDKSNLFKGTYLLNDDMIVFNTYVS